MDRRKEAIRERRDYDRILYGLDGRVVAYIPVRNGKALPPIARTALAKVEGK